MYPLHKYLPTPFGTYLLYIDNGPTRVKVNKDKGELPSYQAVKDYTRQRQQNATVKYEAFQKHGMGRSSAPGEMHRHGEQSRLPAGGKKKSYTPSSNMPNSIWSPKVKRPHLSYNMRQLWHTGQPVKDPPSTVVKVDEVTGAEVVREATWTKDRFSRKHEDMTTSPSFRESRETNEPIHRSSLSLRTDEILKSEASPLGDERGSGHDVFPQTKKSKPKVPPNTAANSPELSEAYKRRASTLRNDMVPRMQRKQKKKHLTLHNTHYKNRLESEPQRHKETQTSPMRFARTSIEHADDTFPGITGFFSPPRSTSVPLESPLLSQSRSKDPRTRNCVQKTGLPPILEGESATQDTKRVPKTVAVETDVWRRRVRRVQEFRSASPTFPIKSKGEFWDDISKARLAHTGNYGLLPFAWKDPLRNRFDDDHTKQQRATEVGKILPVITRMSSVPRVAPYRA
ncbi:uncharacterized protein LOC120332907 [Styela clava]